MIRSLLIFTFTALFAAGAFAGGAEEGVPYVKILFQAINLGILIGLIVFFVRGSIVKAFAQRQADYLDQSQKTEKALKAAEQSLSEIKSTLQKLEQTEKITLEKAQAEALMQKKNYISEAELQAQKISNESQMLIENEIAKAKEHLNEVVLDKALEISSQQISQKNSSQSEAQFMKQLEQVRI
jgi:F-type H+-transporting ATPase subunit b